MQRTQKTFTLKKNKKKHKLETLDRNASIDSIENLHSDVNAINDNVYISRNKCENIICYNDLLPPLLKNGEILNVASYNTSTFQPEYSFKIETIQLHIQFTDRSFDLIQHTLKKTKETRKKKPDYHHKNGGLNNHHKKKKTHKNGKKLKTKKKNKKRNIEQSKPDDPPPAKTASQSRSLSILNLPDLEQPKIKPISEDSVSSMSVTPETFNNHKKKNHKHRNGKKRKLKNNNNNLTQNNGRPNKKRKLNKGNNKNGLKIIDNDVIGDSDEDEEEEEIEELTEENITGTGEDDDYEDIKFEAEHSLIYEISLDDFKFSFFLSLFPQLFVTHHLVYCLNSYKHYYYQNYFSSINNKYEWIQTDIQLMDIYHRYINNHFIKNKMDYNIINHQKYNDYKNRKIVLFFQIRPRSDTESDHETIEYHKQLLMDNLIQINKYRKNEDNDNHKNKNKNKNNGKHNKKNHHKRNNNDLFNNDNSNTFYMIDDDQDTDNTDFNDYNDDLIDDQYKSIYINSSKQDVLVSNVIREINKTNDNDNNENDNDNDNDDEKGKSISIVPGSWESGLCGFCEKKFSTNKCTEQEWIECEFCGKWYHVICSGLTMKDYLKFQNQQQNDNDKKNKNKKKYKCLMCNEE